MTNRIVELARQIRDEQHKPLSQTETDEETVAREAMEDEWIGVLEYKGNSVSWTHSKAKRYGNDLMLAWKALAEIGIHGDGETHIADVIRQIKIAKDETALRSP
jgi:hypothetical protein